MKIEIVYFTWNEFSRYPADQLDHYLQTGMVQSEKSVISVQVIPHESGDSFRDTIVLSHWQ